MILYTEPLPALSTTRAEAGQGLRGISGSQEEKMVTARDIATAQDKAGGGGRQDGLE